MALAVLSQLGTAQAEAAAAAPQPVQLPPLASVRLLEGPFNDAAKANRIYLLAHDADRLLAPFLREAGIAPKKPPYPNWESQGLDGHTAGHYLSALADMIASGIDTDGEFSRRLDYMLSEMDRVQSANGDGYIGGVPKSREFWGIIASGNVAKTGERWAPWYNVHKTFAGLRDACVAGNKPKARDLLVKLGDWCVNLTSKLSDGQMQQMLGHEFGGMNEVIADIYTITGDKKYLECAKRFDHRAITGPLIRGEDQLTGKHANTQIPKIIGMAEVARLTGNQKEDAGARFFWDTVVNRRSVAFGGNSVSEHFNDPKDFSRMIEHREGPETCNTYNMLRLTEKLFASKPAARYADYYERALYNHILAAIDPVDPGYVYFTPLRPEHYRVYSKAEECFWCCVGTGMENPGRYGQFIYAQDKEGAYVNLFIPSVFKAANGISIRQDTRFPAESSTCLTLKLDQPSTFTLRIRHPWWVPEGQMGIRVNGQPVAAGSKPSSYATVRRPWQDGDKVEVELPMHLSVEPLPDGSNWAAILYGPILLAAPAGRDHMVGERAGDGRMAHVATGPTVPLDQVPVLLTTLKDLPKHITPDPQAGPLHFRINEVVDPKAKDGLPLVPFFSLHHSRYQMYWNLSTAEAVAERRDNLAAEERRKAALDAATLDLVRPGEQQSEVEHDFKGEKSETGIHNGRRWRHGQTIQYTLDPRGAKAVELSVTYSGDDRGRTFDIFANNQRIATQELKAESQGRFIEKRYPLPVAVLPASADGRVTIRFVAKTWLAGGVYDVRLISSKGAPAAVRQTQPGRNPILTGGPDPNFHIYLCFGQSNMESGGKMEESDRTVDERFQTLADFDAPNRGWKKGQWYHAVPPLTAKGTGISIVDSFGRTMVAGLPGNIRVGVVKVSVPGCKIELFDKAAFTGYAETAPPWMKNMIKAYDGNPYQYLVDLGKVAQKDGVIKGILLHQGESNPGDREWPNKVKGIYENLLKDLDLKAGDVPLLAGETVNADQGGVCAGMNDIIADLPKTLPNSHVISSAACTCQPDRLHFDPAGSREFGKRYGEKMLSLQGYLNFKNSDDPTQPGNQPRPSHWNSAPTPPMGWNSWDIFGTTVTEEQAMAQADAMAKHLKPAGWTYFTVDIQWYAGGSEGHIYKEGAPLTMDEHSRLMPALDKFPSAANGVGFKKLGEYVHSKGLKFGIHIMRGIPRQAVKRNTPILGTNVRAADIADVRSTCAWNPDMYGVDMGKPGAREYYDSLFQLYASWGVDFVKCDDISRPYNDGQKAEIEALRKSIDKCGRPMVLSLSPGDTPIERGGHVMQYANMWRISDDFWDRWEPLHGMFGRLEKWTKYRTPGAWPDADMLPFGIVEFKRPTRFTKDEQILCMTLWSIARSPLIFGGDMTKLDEFTLNLLTNREVLAVNQASDHNRQISRKDDLIVWAADVPNSDDRYVALFNAQSNDAPFDFNQAIYKSPLVSGRAGEQVIDIKVPIKGAKSLVLVVGDGGDGFFYDHAAWIEPTITGAKGSLKLTNMKWVSAKAGFGNPLVNRSVDDKPLTLNGQPVDGIGTHSVSMIEYKLPEGYETFSCRGVSTPGGNGKGHFNFLVLVDPIRNVRPEQSKVSVSFSDIGMTGTAAVRDLWRKQDLGVFADGFSQELPLHGSGLFRISPKP